MEAWRTRWRPDGSPAQAEKLRLYRSIATMDKSAPLPLLRNQKPTWSRAAEVARDLQHNKLAERLDGLAA